MFNDFWLIKYWGWEYLDKQVCKIIRSLCINIKINQDKSTKLCRDWRYKDKRYQD